MKKKSLISIFLLFSMMFTLLITPAAALEDPGLQCRNAILMDSIHDDVLYEKGGYEKAYPASLTKIMTALLVVEAIDRGEIAADTPVTAGETALQGLSGNFSTAGVKPGNTLTVEELLYCLMLPSANEAANILAVAVDGSIEDFVAHMNRRAGTLGCKDTHFMNPHGLHHPEHYTTAYDLALITDAALEHDLFRTVIKTPSYKIAPNDTHGEIYFFNTNGLISNLYYSNYVYDKCIGGKTGSTDEAGRCLMSVAVNGDDTYISVVLGSGPIPGPNGSLIQGQFSESTKLFKWGFDNFRRVEITQDSEPVATVPVALSRTAKEVMVRPSGTITRTIPKDVDLDKMEKEISVFDGVVAPVKANQVLGTMKLSYEGQVYGTIDLVAVEAVERSELLYQKERFLNFMKEYWKVMALAAAAVVVLVLILRFTLFNKKRRYGSHRNRVRGNYRGFRHRY